MNLSMENGRQPSGLLWSLDDPADETVTVDLGTSLSSLGFLRAALRRSAWLWCGLAMIGLLAGFAALKAKPAFPEASTTLLVADLPGSATGVGITDDQAIVQSRAVAAIALGTLGLHESAASFANNYSATIVTDRVLTITAKASSGQDAIRDSNAVASAFLTFQARLLTSQQKLVDASLQQQVNAAQQHVDSLTHQISKLTGPSAPASSATQSDLNALRIERSRAANALTVLQETVDTTVSSDQAAVTTAIKTSGVLDPAALVHQSPKKRVILNAGGGLLAGLVIGCAIVIFAALASDRLRRRDDVARILGVPVRLSVGKAAFATRRSVGLAAAETATVRQIVSHLRHSIFPCSSGPGSLAVVPVDDYQVPALSLVALAVSVAEKGMRVVIVDLCAGAPAAHLLGVHGPGVRQVSVQNVQIAVAVPDSDDPAPAGPLLDGSPDAGLTELFAVCKSADLLLTLANLDPATGGDHITGWARSIVAVVTAGRSSAARVQAVGEMIRLARPGQASAVLIGADRSDASLGTSILPASEQDMLAGRGPRYDARGTRVGMDKDAVGEAQ